MPKEKVKLYSKAVDILVSRWQTHKSGEDELNVSEDLKKFLIHDNVKLRQALERLAYESHRFEKDKRIADLKRSEAVDILDDPKYLKNLALAGEFLDYVDQRSGLLIGKGGNDHKPLSYGFPHRTFQEYLAGCYVVTHRNGVREVMRHAAEGDYWSLAIQLGFEELLYNRLNENALFTLAYSLCGNISSKSISEERQHLWSSNIARLLGVYKIKDDTIDPNGGTKYLDRLRHSLGQLLSGKLPFEERTEAGRNLAKLGNERELDALKINPVFSLRKAATELSDAQKKAMLRKFDFADTYDNKEGKGCVHVYHPEKDGKVVIDYATGLMWQQSGSPESGNYEKAQAYIKQLNANKFAGYNDWRLPTLEEAMSLMERERKNGNLYIDPVFDAKQNWIWTADRDSASGAWFVNFNGGYCYDRLVDVGSFYVRAVRS